MNQKNCIYCEGQFTPKTENQKFCSSRCRTAEFRERNPVSALQNPVSTLKKPVTETRSDMITEDILERILQEREERYKAELQRQKAEMKLEAMESRLQAIEKQLKEDEKEPPEQSIGGFKLTDIVQAYQMYQQMQTPNK